MLTPVAVLRDARFSRAPQDEVFVKFAAFHSPGGPDAWPGTFARCHTGTQTRRLNGVTSTCMS